ncbi:amino acid ABC transporter permease [Desulfopila inferna]|uniref:amino acid ABC transporter permease n=1 Tax=Desulfopila inferna TaxID=468528 RepID=UPI001965EE5B|nr:amino acid ABC transporter permease [Desulfopila inferna]MBM9606312.1 amino acid ABC transporter permease [Desulfopila inferna]
MIGPLSHKSENRPRVRKPSPIPDTLQFVILMAALVFLFTMNIEELGYNWQWYQVGKYIYTFEEHGFTAGPLLEGLKVTLQISAISMLFALLIGFITAFLRLADAPVARLFARLYLEITRNTPLLIQIFFIYFVLGPVLGLERFLSAVLALSLFEGAYVSEIIRSGILSVDSGQREAGYSLGLGKSLTYRHIILPQALRNTLPPLTNQAISLVKDSALVSTIAIYDLTMQAQSIIAETFLTFEIWFTIALMYLLITISLSFAVSIMEKRMQSTGQH